MTAQHHDITRRRLIGSLSAIAGLSLLGCGSAERDEQSGGERAATGSLTATPVAMTVYRDPSCGCCEAWAAVARKAGFQVNVVNNEDMAAVKQHFGIPKELRSCHTTVFGGYAFEGHVPLESVRQVLAKRPLDIKGIAVPGMPAGSPGMEVPNGTKQPFQVMAFDASGGVKPFTG